MFRVIPIIDRTMAKVEKTMVNVDLVSGSIDVSVNSLLNNKQI